MAIPKFVDFMLPTLEVMGDGFDHNADSVSGIVSQKLRLSEEDKALRIHRRYIYVIRTQWALCKLFQAGLLIRIKRAVYRITDAGLKVLKDKPLIIDEQFLMQFEPYKRTENEKIENTAVNQEETTPEEAINKAVEEMNKSLAQELLEQVKACKPDFFENLVVDLLCKMGYGDTGQVVGKSGDGGIDGIINEDKLGLDKIYIQAKRWQGNVGSKELNSFAGSLDGMHTDKGVFITTSDFTRDACQYVEKAKKNIILINGQRLVGLMIEHDIGVSEQSKLIIKKVDHDYFSDEDI